MDLSYSIQQKSNFENLERVLARESYTPRQSLSDSSRCWCISYLCGTKLAAFRMLTSADSQEKRVRVTT